ncbi:hypothetical protein BT93_B2054 [Corymbia citriodora subsp. variegata]|nr:hypothetical protein BT93_B2054 [Corymbia citriodora subsp. variegata]
MMAQFKSNFVAAASNSQNQGINSSSNMHASKRPAMTGFVSGGSIGGDAYKAQTTKSSSTPTSGANPPGHRPTENAGHRSSESSRDRTRERRRPSGWDR